VSNGLINDILIANFSPENLGIGTPKSRDFGIGKRAGIQGFRDPGINPLMSPNRNKGCASDFGFRSRIRSHRQQSHSVIVDRWKTSRQKTD